LNKKLVSFTNFDKGLNTNSSLDELDVSELITANNVDLIPRGGFKQRLGSYLYDDLEICTDPIEGVIEYPGGSFVIANKVMYKIATHELIYTFNSSLVSYEFFTNSKLYLVDGTNYFVYDGTTVAAVSPGADSDLTPIKRCTKLLQRGQRLFALGDPQNPNFLYYSEIGDPTIFKASSIVKAITDDLDVLKAMSLYSDSLLAFKEREIFRWSGWDPQVDVVFNPMGVGFGTVSQDTLKPVDNYLIFASTDGIRVINTLDNNVVKSYNVSKNISSLYGSLTNLENMKAIVFEGNYYLACCDDNSGHNNKVIKVYPSMAYTDEENDSLIFPCVIYTGWNVSGWFIASGRLYFSSSIDQKVYKAFADYTDNETPVVAELSYYLQLGDSSLQEKIKKIFLIAKQTLTTRCIIELTIEGGYYKISKTIDLNESLIWGVTNWGDTKWGWVDTIVKELTINHNLNRVKVTIKHNRVDELMTIYGFSTYYKTKKPRGSKNGIHDNS
jgi:hypothetical protein